MSSFLPYVNEANDINMEFKHAETVISGILTAVHNCSVFIARYSSKGAISECIIYITRIHGRPINALAVIKTYREDVDKFKGQFTKCREDFKLALQMETLKRVVGKGPLLFITPSLVYLVIAVLLL
jgi:hypothetical protein